MTLSVFRLAASAASASLLAIACVTPAQAQAWIGEMVGNMMAQQQAWAAEHACMTGAAMPASEVAEALPTTRTTMLGYWETVKSGAPAAIAPHFHVSKKSAWTSGQNRIAVVPGVKITDPFAVPGANLAAEPRHYYRSGDGASVRMQWEVLAGDGALIGTYDAELRRAGSVWRLYDVALLPATTYVEPLVQYCHKVGDVMPYRLNHSEAVKNQTAKRALKMEEKARKAEAASDKATARMVKASGASAPGDKVQASELADKARTARTKAVQAQQAAVDAAAAHNAALADAKAMEDARLAAKARLANP